MCVCEIKHSVVQCGMNHVARHYDGNHHCSFQYCERCHLKFPVKNSFRRPWKSFGSLKRVVQTTNQTYQVRDTSILRLYKQISLGQMHLCFSYTGGYCRTIWAEKTKLPSRWLFLIMRKFKSTYPISIWPITS